MLGLGLSLNKANTPSAAYSNTYSLELDGVNDYSANTNPIDIGGNQITSFMWLKPGTMSITTGLYNLDDFAGLAFFKFFTMYQLYLYHGQGTYSRWDNCVIPDGSWTNLVIYYDRTNPANDKLWKNGINQGPPDNITGTTYGTESVNVELGQMIGWTNFDGKIDEFAIFEGDVSSSLATLVGDNWNSSFDLSSESPKHWWRMGDSDGGAGSTITNDGSESVTQTLYAGASIVEDSF
jgi:hypothetical protein